MSLSERIAARTFAWVMILFLCFGWYLVMKDTTTVFDKGLCTHHTTTYQQRVDLHCPGFERIP